MKKSIFIISIITSLILCSMPIYATTSYDYNFSVNERGEYNITLTASNMSKPILYKKNILGRFKKVTNNIKITKFRNGYTIKGGLDAKKKYKIQGTAYKYPKITIYKNEDIYSTSTSLCSNGIEWNPNDDSIQPYDLQGILTMQKAYLTKEEALIYYLNLDQNKYLKLIDTSIQLSALLVAFNINPASSIGRAFASMSRNKLIKIAKTIVSVYGGIHLIPSLTSTLKNTVKTRTNNFTNGLLITVTLTPQAGCINSYDPWNGQMNTVIGKSGYRGTFTKLTRIKGWY